MKPTPLLLTLLLPSLLSADQSYSIDRNNQSITIKSNNHEILVYQLQKPDNKKYPLDSACYFHPLRSASGKILTDFANPNHPHHRGIFLGWVEMHGKKDADFWGWGEPAPTKGRKIVNRSVERVSSSDHDTSFVAQNQWLADDVVMMNERLEARVHPVAHAY